MAVHLCLPAAPAPDHPTGNSDQITYGARMNIVYRCYLPVLTGFTSIRRIGSSRQRSDRAPKHLLRPSHAGIQPCYSGLQADLRRPEAVGHRYLPV